jgi:hypothetical protein
VSQEIKKILTDPPKPPPLGQALYKAEKRSPWNAMQNNQLIEGYPSRIRRDCQLHHTKNGLKNILETTIFLDNDPYKYPRNSNSHLPYGEIEEIKVVFLSSSPLQLNHIEIGKPLRIEQTTLGVRINDVVYGRNPAHGTAPPLMAIPSGSSKRVL